MYYNNKDVRLEEMPVPEIGAGELLMKVHACGICGSDVMEWYRIKKAPRVLGHEAAGEVVKAGAGVKNFKKGDRIFVTHHVPCYKCGYCRDGKHTVCETLRTTNFYPGGFAEYLRIPKINVETGTWLLPPGMSYTEGSFIEPLGCAVRAQRLAGMKKGYSVLVLGSGISGILHIQLAKALGAKRIFATDISEYRLRAAERFGADLAINAGESIPDAVKKANDGKLADLVILCTGALPAVKQALQSVGDCGTILVFAPTGPSVETPVNLCDIWLRGVNIVNSYAAVKQDLEEALELISKKKVNVEGMVTHRLPLAETGKGFRLMTEAGDSLKILVEPGR